MTELRPPLVFRVGVARNCDVAEDDARLCAAVASCLSVLRGEIGELARRPEAARAYAPQSAGEPPIALRVVSQLAPGADRIVARAALEAHDELYAPLPFAKDQYRRAFAVSAAEFEELFERARKFELDGRYDAGESNDALDGTTPREEGYEAAGRYVVRNCDLLIAIWDGKRSGGLGDVGAIAAFAARTGVRVWWIHAHDDAPATLISNVGEFHDVRRAPVGALAAIRLREFLARELLPPAYGPPECEGVFDLLAEVIRRAWVKDRAPLEEFLAETPLSPNPLWRTYETFMKAVTVASYQDLVALLRPATKAQAPLEAPQRGWEAVFRAADAASLAYGDRYRSSYVLVATFAIFALASASFGGEPARGWQWAFIFVEIASLLAISVLVVVNFAWRWHERWISYRLLAELARKQSVLALIGQSLPGADVQLLASYPDRRLPQGEGEAAEKPPRDAWVAWLFMAHRRAAAPPTGAIADYKRQALRAGQRMIDAQIEYHEGRARRSHLAGLRVRRISEGFFLLAFALAFWKLALIWRNQGWLIHDIVFFAAAVSSVATAFVGIRAYAEFTLLVRQSRHMILALEADREELKGLEGAIENEQTSLQLGRTLYATTTAMMQDITGWAHLFRVKTLEAA